ncbi:MAG TPA: DUF4440 domain-containing protein [Pyrinomonadaceae bacterium]|nr:DUF4440 domain-containing protein [Pyrinomonadaceae bacterium]
MEEIREEIRNINLKFAELFKHGDAAGVAALYTADAHLMPPDTPPVRGADAIEAFWRGAMKMGVKSATLETVEVESSGGDLATEIGQFTLGMDAPGGGRAEMIGKYIVLWKRDGGVWKLHADIWNGNAPASAARP